MKLFDGKLSLQQLIDSARRDCTAVADGEII